jgi:O-antigen ligase
VDGRRQAWVLAFAHWQERPLFGHGTLAGGHLVKDGWWYSSLVQALYDTGLFGFAVLVALYTGALALPVRAWLRTRRTSDVNLLGFGAGNTILMVASQFSSFLFVGFPWIFLGLSMAAVQAARHAEPKEETAGRRSPISAAELPHAARDERTG